MIVDVHSGTDIGVSDETSNTGPFLTDSQGNPLVPDILNGYYILIDKYEVKDKAMEGDILHRGSFNFTLGHYDTDTNTLYFCKLDTYRKEHVPIFTGEIEYDQNLGG